MNTKDWLNRMARFKYTTPVEQGDKLGGEGRCSGRTTAMLQQVIDCILEGQPKCVIIGHNVEHARILQIETLNLMLDRGLAGVDSRYPIRTILYEDSEIRFISKDQYERFIEGTRGWGEFWDHAAEEASSPELLQ